MQPGPPVDAASEADWLTIWQSELAALAVDREAHEQLAVALRAMAAPRDGNASRNARGDARGNDPPAGCPGADAAARPAAPGAAPEPLGQELDRLRRRISELERGPVPPA